MCVGSAELAEGDQGWPGYHRAGTGCWTSQGNPDTGGLVGPSRIYIEIFLALTWSCSAD